MEQNPEQKKPSAGLKITVLVILIVLLVAGILLPIRIIPGALSSIANSLSALFTPRENVRLSVDRSTVNSGDAVMLRWTGKPKTNGSYVLNYGCTPGVRLETSINQPYETIPCDSQFYFSPSENSLSLSAFSNSRRYADAKISLGFLENNAMSVNRLSDITITIVNAKLADGLPAGTSTTTSPQTSSTTPPATRNQYQPTTPNTSQQDGVQYRVNPYGLADLEVRVVAVGHRTDTGVFVPSATVRADQQAAIKFQIVNVGDNYSGSWTFSADLPSLTDPRFISSNQQSLGPGDRIEYVLGFNNLNTASDSTATIFADSSNLLREYSENNNVARARFNASIGQVPATPIPGTLPDLTIRITATGIVDRSTNAFTQTNSVHVSDRAGIRFEVQNVGQTATGSWKFRATLPSSDQSSQTFMSDVQPSLNPGERVVLTIGFEGIQYQGANTATVTVDSDNNVSESLETNNTASVTIVRS